MSMAIGLLIATLASMPDQWINENGPVRAKAVVESCLRDANHRLSDPNICALRPFKACEDEHGTSQRQMNDCATFSRLAWEERRADAAKRLLAAKSYGARFPLPEPHIKRLVEIERRWDAWNRSDCEMQAAFSQGGTYHRYDLDICLSNHAAHRAIELENLGETWNRIFNLDGS